MFGFFIFSFNLSFIFLIFWAAGGGGLIPQLVCFPARWPSDELSL
jgi:hypothetical protein